MRTGAHCTAAQGVAAGFLGLLFAALGLAACGGGDAGQDDPPCLTTVTIQLFGDSTQLGSPPRWEAKGDLPEPLLQAALDAEFGAGTTMVIARGVGATTSQELRDGTDTLNKPWPQSVAADFVLINHGINDMRGVEGVTPAVGEAQFEANLRFFAQTPGVILETPIRPWNAEPKDYAVITRRVAAELGLPLIEIRKTVQEYPDWCAVFSPDCVHLNDAGKQFVIRQAIMPVLRPLVASRLCPEPGARKAG